MTKLPMHGINDIRAMDLLRNLSRGLPDDWHGTALDILRIETLPAHTRLRIVLDETWIPVSTLTRFAFACAEWGVERCRERGREPDGRVSIALMVLRRWMLGRATESEIAVARRLAQEAATESRNAILYSRPRSAGLDAAPLVAAALDPRPGAAARDAAYYAQQLASDIVWETTLLAEKVERARNEQSAKQVAYLIELLEAEKGES